MLASRNEISLGLWNWCWRHDSRAAITGVGARNKWQHTSHIRYASGSATNSREPEARLATAALGGAVGALAVGAGEDGDADDGREAAEKEAEDAASAKYTTRIREGIAREHEHAVKEAAARLEEAWQRDTR